MCKIVKRFLYKFLYNNKYTLQLLLMFLFYATDSFAAGGTFSALNTAGTTIFGGLRKIVFSAATIGVACVCIAGMFGSFNWKWFAAIAIGVLVMSYYSSPSTVQSDLTGNI